jgi:hypothetical protein
MTLNRAFCFSLAGAFMSLAGCYSADADVAPDFVPAGPGFSIGDVTYAERCVRHASDECRETCDQCWDLCAGAAVETGGSCAGTCADICDCPVGEDDACLQRAYSFEAERVDPDVANACEDMWSAYANNCGGAGSTMSSWCRDIARISAPTAGDFFRRCALSLASSDLCLAACSYDGVPFSAELCEGFQARCGTCPLADTLLIDDWAGFMRREILDAARACLELESCSDTATCLLAWEELLSLG